MSCPLCSISKAADGKHLKLSHPTSAPVRVHFSPGFRWGWVGVLGLPPQHLRLGGLEQQKPAPPRWEGQRSGCGQGRTLREGPRGGWAPSPLPPIAGLLRPAAPPLHLPESPLGAHVAFPLPVRTQSLWTWLCHRDPTNEVTSQVQGSEPGGGGTQFYP